MSDYISREAALNACCEGCSAARDCRPGERCVDYMRIKEIPAADVALVRHGHKITHNRPIAGYWASGLLDGGVNGMEGRVWVMPIMDNPVDYCSECGKRLDDTFQNYCPNCGCAMEVDK